MTDLAQRIAALREAVRQAHHTIKDEDGRIHHVQWYAIDLIDEQAAEIERLRTGDTCGRMCEGAAYRIAARSAEAEIERLRARVAELESMVGLSSREVNRLTALILKAHAEDERMNAIAQNGNDGLHYRDAGPTPLRGRITGRDRD